MVDTPGWEGAGTEGETPERVRREITAGLALCPPGPHAVLVTLRVDVVVTAAEVARIEEQMTALGEGVWRHAVLLFTRGDKLREGVTGEQHIQSGGMHLRQLVQRCGDRCHVISNVSISTSAPASVLAVQPHTQVLQLLDKVCYNPKNLSLPNTV